MIDDQQKLDIAVQRFIEIKKSFTLSKFLKVSHSMLTYICDAKFGNLHVGVSGGVDSAFMLYWMHQLNEERGLGWNIQAHCITYDKHKPDFDLSYIEELNDDLQHKDRPLIKIVDQSDALDLFLKPFGEPTSFQIEQTSYALRYQHLFSAASRDGGLVIGTTNKDELSYAGWFGMHSDMTVDLLATHHFHKFEVIHLARELRVPSLIIDRVPVGDLPDKSTDEENFGCTYDELAWYSVYKQYVEMTSFLEEKFKKLEALHQSNAHKYQANGLRKKSYNPIFI